MCVPCQRKIHILNHEQYNSLYVIHLFWYRAGMSTDARNVTWTSGGIKSDRDYGTANRRNCWHHKQNTQKKHWHHLNKDKRSTLYIALILFFTTMHRHNGWLNNSYTLTIAASKKWPHQLVSYTPSLALHSGFVCVLTLFLVLKFVI